MRKEMTLSKYIEQSIENIEKRIDRAKNKNDNFHPSVLKRVDIDLRQADINSIEFLNFSKQHRENLKTKIKCTDIENDLEYDVESEQHDYWHTSYWITNVVNNYLYSYYVLKTKDEIDYSMLIKEAVNIAEIMKDSCGLIMLRDFEKLIRSKKMFNEKIKGIIKL